MCPDSTSHNGSILKRVKDYTDKGLSVTLKLHDGEVVFRFRSHFIIAPHGINNVQENLNEAIVGGIVCLDNGDQGDRAIMLRDILDVTEEGIPPFFADNKFFVRYALPDGWTTLARAPESSAL